MASVQRNLPPRTIHLHWLERQRTDGRRGLCAVLSDYCGEAPETLAIEQRDRLAKPQLPAHPWLRFNWSHSGRTALVAVAREIEVGVDVEYGARQVQVMPLAERFFAAEEVQALRLLSAGERRRVFLRMWTAKEAVLKALGLGLAGGIDRVVVRSDSPTRLALVRLDVPDLHGSVQLRALATATNDLVASVAWRGPPCALRVIDDSAQTAPAIPSETP